MRAKQCKKTVKKWMGQREYIFLVMIPLEHLETWVPSILYINKQNNVKMARGTKVPKYQIWLSLNPSSIPRNYIII